jgi:4-oxalocrotonate tautomerase
MPFIEIKVIEGAFTHEEKRQMVQQVSEAVIAVEGEPLRPFTHTSSPKHPAASGQSADTR